MKTPINSHLSKSGCPAKISAWSLAALIALSAAPTRAANISWQGGTADYTTAADWVGGVVPGPNDNAINDNGTNNAVRISLGNPDWTISQIRAGNGAGDGAFVQNGQAVTLRGTNFPDTAIVTPFRLGIAAADTGLYTLNGGSINYSNGGFNVGELGVGVLNINGGTITGSGFFWDNFGTLATPSTVTATVGGDISLADYTWFQQGAYAADGTVGLPAPGSTIVSASQSDHSYITAPSYTGNDAVMVSTNVPNATITLASATVASGLSFMGTAGNGPTVVNYTVHHADSTIETGSFSVQDWFATGQNVLGVGGRVDPLGITFQTFGAGNNPHLWSFDIALTNITSAVASIDLAYVSGGTACMLGVSSSTGSGFVPLAMTGYNEDIIVESAATPVAAGITDVVNQSGGAVNVTGAGQFVVGNVGAGIYNLSGGSVDVHNYIAFGRSSGSGTMNMTGGTFNQDGGGNLLVGTGFNNNGTPATGVFNQSAGIINCQGQFLCPEQSPSTGTYNLSGTGSLIVNNWLVFGRSGGAGTLNMTGGSILQTNSGGNFEVGETTPGTANQSGGTITTYNELWIGQGGGSVGQYSLSGTGMLTVHNWLVVGRSGGTGVLNITNSTSVVRDNNNNAGANFDVGAGGPGTVNQDGGTVTNLAGATWIGETAKGTWNLNSGVASLGPVVICVANGASGTLNLNGGFLQVSGINSSSSGVSTLNFNGSTIQATAASTNFISGLGFALVGVNGVVIDSQGFNLAVPQELDDSGGGTITKIGSGVLTLNGPNTYGGATIISAGTLGTTTASTGGGTYTVAGGAGLGVQVAGSANTQLASSAVTFSGPANTLNIDLNAFGNPTVAPLNAQTLTVNGTVTVNVLDAAPATGQFPLIQYAAETGAGSFVLGSLPSGELATLSNNVANSTIDLVVTRALGAPRWNGNVAGGVWDINTTPNWIDIATLSPTTYQDGQNVLLDDTATGTTTINLTAAVTPGSVTVNNSSLPYTIGGAGSINGSIGLSKQGTASLSLLNNNGYTGPTTISAGTLNVTSLANGGSPSPIGASSASPTNLVINGATFEYSGAPLAANRGFTVAATNSTIDAEGNLTLSGMVATKGSNASLHKTGPGQLTFTTAGVNQFAVGYNPGILVQNGGMVLDGSAGNQTNHTVNECWVGGTPAFGGSLVLTNTILNVDSWLGLGRGNGTINNTSTFTMYNSRATFGNVSLGYDNGISGNLAQQFLTLHGNSTLTDGGAMNLSESSGSTATITLYDTSAMSCSANCLLGGNNPGSAAFGYLTISNSAKLTVGSYISIGNGKNCVGSLLVANNGSLTVGTDFNVTDNGPSTAFMTLQDNAVASGNTVYVGKNAGDVATLTVSNNATLIARNGDLQMGASGQATCNQSGGTVIGTNWISIGRNSGGVSVYNLTGGTLLKIFTGNGTRLNVAENGTGTLNVSGSGSVNIGAADLDICSAAGNGTLNLNGGSITAGFVTHLGTGTATFNLNGGTLTANPGAGTNFISGLSAANIKSGGATINSGTNIINIRQPLLDGTGGGGLTKTGNGTLYLNGANTYTGLTLVNNGTLGGIGSVLSPVTVVSGATLTAGVGAIGTLTINNTLTLAAGSTTALKLTSTSNSQIAGLTGVTYGGTLIVTNTSATPLTVGQTFTLFSSTAAGSGSFNSVTLLPAGTASFNPSTGVLTVTSIGAGVVFSPVTVSGGNLILTGTGGGSGTSYNLLSTTNLLTGWITNTTGSFSSSGTFTNTIPVSPSIPAQFFRIGPP